MSLISQHTGPGQYLDDENHTMRCDVYCILITSAFEVDRLYRRRYCNWIRTGLETRSAAMMEFRSHDEDMERLESDRFVDITRRAVNKAKQTRREFHFTRSRLG